MMNGHNGTSSSISDAMKHALDLPEDLRVIVAEAFTPGAVVRVSDQRARELVVLASRSLAELMAVADAQASIMEKIKGMAIPVSTVRRMLETMMLTTRDSIVTTIKKIGTLENSGLDDDAQAAGLVRELLEKACNGIAGVISQGKVTVEVLDLIRSERDLEKVAETEKREHFRQQLKAGEINIVHLEVGIHFPVDGLSKKSRKTFNG